MAILSHFLNTAILLFYLNVCFVVVQVQRLSQYEEFFEDLVREAHQERLREDEDIQAALLRAKQVCDTFNLSNSLKVYVNT